MAKKTEQTEPVAATENAPAENTPKTQKDPSPEVPAAPEPTPAPSENKTSTPAKPKLISFTELCNKHRLPTWQSAAVLRLLEKEDDVFLSEKEFLQALERLSFRKMGSK